MLQYEGYRNQELLGRIKKLEDRETEAAKNLSEQVEANRVLRKNQEGLHKKLEERDLKLNTANGVHTHTPHPYIQYFCVCGHVSSLMLAFFF